MHLYCLRFNSKQNACIHTYTHVCMSVSVNMKTSTSETMHAYILVNTEKSICRSLQSIVTLAVDYIY